MLIMGAKLFILPNELHIDERRNGFVSYFS